MKSDLIISAAGHWYAPRAGKWSRLPGQPVIDDCQRIIIDFDGAFGKVAIVDSKPEFAAAIIEKRVRAEGQVDGDAKILIHRSIYVGGTTRALYTAVPLAVWNQTFAWLESQPSAGLVYPVNAMLERLAHKHGAVLCRIGRQFRLLVCWEETLTFISTTAFSDDPDDIRIALNSLIDQAGPRAIPTDQGGIVHWYDLMAGDDEMERKALIEIVSEKLKIKIVPAPTAEVVVENAPSHRSAIDAMAEAAPLTASANPGHTRLAALTHRLSWATSALCAVAGLCLAVGAISLYFQATATRLEANQRLAEARALNESIANERPTASPNTYAETAAFLERLDKAAQAANPYQAVLDVRRAAEQRVRIMRLRLTPTQSILIDGVTLSGIQGDSSLLEFIAALRNSGYQIKAEDPGNRSQAPGFFSYSLITAEKGAKK